jgi:DUF971 family protein
MTDENAACPSEIRLNGTKDQLDVVFEQGDKLTLSAEYLRVFSPSAEVQGHAPGERKVVPGKRTVTITKIEPVGNYAIRPIFSDGHDSGLFTWLYLRELGKHHDTLWAQYLDELEKLGLSRG